MGKVEEERDMGKVLEAKRKRRDERVRGGRRVGGMRVEGAEGRYRGKVGGSRGRAGRADGGRWGIAESLGGGG